MGDESLGSLQFRMLGPLEAWRGGTPLRLGGERQRALLALLLVHANELVRTEQLVDQLLGETVSDGALNTARVAVSRLRRVLENGDDGILITRPGVGAGVTGRGRRRAGGRAAARGAGTVAWAPASRSGLTRLRSTRDPALGAIALAGLDGANRCRSRAGCRFGADRGARGAGRVQPVAGAAARAAHAGAVSGRPSGGGA